MQTATDMIHPDHILELTLLDISALVIAMRTGIVTVLGSSRELARLLGQPDGSIDAAAVLERGQKRGWFGDTSAANSSEKRYAVTSYGQTLASSAVIRLLTVITFPDQQGAPVSDLLAILKAQGGSNVRH